MRALTALAPVLALALAACSQPEYYEMRPSSVTFETKGARKQVRAVALDRRGNEYPTRSPLRWESSDESIATVDEEGRITAVGYGVARVRAVRDDLVGEVLVDVNTVEELVLEPAEIRVQQDGTPVRAQVRLLDGRGKELSGRTVQARCMDEKICTSDRIQQIWGHTPGETDFEVVYEGMKARARVIVEPAKRR